MTRMAWAMLAVLGAAAPLEAQTVLPEGQAPQVVELRREAFPMVGRRVLTPGPGVTIAAIERRQTVEARVRTQSGAVLSAAAQAAVQESVLGCARGEPRDSFQGTDFNGTYVFRFDCVWLQTGPVQ